MRWLQINQDFVKKKNFCSHCIESIGKEKQNLEMDKDSSWELTIQRRELFRNDMIVRFLKALLGYSRDGSEDDDRYKLIDGSIVWLGHLDAWIETLLEYLLDKETPGWARTEVVHWHIREMHAPDKRAVH